MLTDPMFTFLLGAAVGVLVAAGTVTVVNRRELARLGAPAAFPAIAPGRRSRAQFHVGRVRALLVGRV